MEWVKSILAANRMDTKYDCGKLQSRGRVEKMFQELHGVLGHFLMPLHSRKHLENQGENGLQAESRVSFLSASNVDLFCSTQVAFDHYSRLDGPGRWARIWVASVLFACSSELHFACAREDAQER